MKTYSFVRSTQIFFTTLGMFAQNQGKLLKWILFGILFVDFIAFYMFYAGHFQDVVVFGQYYWAKLIMALSAKTRSDVIELVWDGHHYKTTFLSFVQSHWALSRVNEILNRLIVVGILNLLVILFFLVGSTYYFTKKGQAIKETKFVRGMRLANNQDLVYEMKRKKLAGDFFITACTTLNSPKPDLKIPFVKDFALKHVLVHGTTGTGKSQLIMSLLDQIKLRGDKVIVYDKGCTLVKHFFDAERGDILLNPFDERCANWDLWRDAPKPHLLDNMAAALISQDGSTNDPFWVNAARVIFAQTAQTMKQKGNCTIEELLDILLIRELGDLGAFLKNTEASTLVEGKAEKMAISIRSILATYCRSLRFLVPVNKHHQGQNSFSIREWMQEKDQKGWIFISCRDDEMSVLKPLISLWLDTAVNTLMSMEVDYDRRIWFVYDEIASLQKLPSLKTGLAEIRKFGGCMILGMQSLLQLQSIYGRDETQAISSLLNTRLFFSSPDPETAKLVSSNLGEQDIEEARESYSYGTNSVRDGISLGMQKVTRRLVDYAEIMSLKDLQFYLRQIGDLPITRVNLFKNLTRPICAESFVALETQQFELDPVPQTPTDTEEQDEMTPSVQKRQKSQKGKKVEKVEKEGKSKTKLQTSEQDVVTKLAEEGHDITDDLNLD